MKITKLLTTVGLASTFVISSLVLINTNSALSQSTGKLGTEWNITEGVFGESKGRWIRQGDSETFNVSQKNTQTSQTVNFQATIYLNGNNVSIQRFNSSDGNNCNYTGTMSGNNVSGTYYCNSGGPYNWSGSIEGQSKKIGATPVPATTNINVSSKFYANASWCIWHEGVWLYQKNSNQLVSPRYFRTECSRAQSHSGALHIINGASDEYISAFLRKAASQLPIEKSFEGNLRWVAYHEKRINELKTWANRGRADMIRQIYSSEQGHNPNTRNLHVMISDRQLIEMCLRM